MAVDGGTDDNDMDIIVRFKRIICCAGFVQHFPTEGIYWRAGVSEPADMIDDLGLNRFEMWNVGHGGCDASATDVIFTVKS